MLKISELAVTCKTVVRISEIRFAHNSEIVSRDLSVDWTREKRERKEGERGGTLSQFSVAWLVNLSQKSTQMAPAQSHKEVKDKNTDEVMRELAGEEEAEREAIRGDERCFYCFLKEHSALLFCRLQWSVLWCNESPGSRDCHKYCTVRSSHL